MKELRNFLVNVYLKQPDIHITGVYMSTKSDPADGSINVLLGNDIDATVPKYVISYDNIAFIERAIPGSSVQKNNDELTSADLPQPQENQPYGAVSVRALERQKANKESVLADKIPIVELQKESDASSDIPPSLEALPLSSEKSFADTVAEQMENDPRSAPIHFAYGDSLEALRGWKKPKLSTTAVKKKKTAKKRRKLKSDINE